MEHARTYSTFETTGLNKKSITTCTLGDLFYVNSLVNRKAVQENKIMSMSLVIPLSAGFTTNMRQLKGAPDNLSGKTLQQIQTNICTRLSFIQLSRQIVRGNSIAKKTTKFQKATTYQAAVFQRNRYLLTSLERKQHYPIN
jgi:hypothetical protein